VASSCDNRVEELIAERNKIGGRKFKASKPAQQAITHLCALFDQLVPYAHPAPAEQDEALNLLAHICDNLNDLPISDKWAKSIVERITAMLDARYGVRDFVRPAPAAQGWRPIESAPRDGTCVLVCHAGSVGEARYIEDEGWWWAGAYPTDACGPDSIRPTHWMPLPEPPQPEQKEGGR